MSPPATAPTPDEFTAYAVSLILQGARDPVRLRLTVVSEDNPDVKSEEFDLSKGKATAYKRDDPTLAGTEVHLDIKLPASLKPGADNDSRCSPGQRAYLQRHRYPHVLEACGPTPRPSLSRTAEMTGSQKTRVLWARRLKVSMATHAGVIILNKFPEPDGKDESAPFVASVVLKPTGGSELTYSAYTYIDLDQSDRWIFPAATTLPGFKNQATPAGLAYFRQKELEQLQVEPALGQTLFDFRDACAAKTGGKVELHGIIAHNLGCQRALRKRSAGRTPASGIEFKKVQGTKDDLKDERSGAERIYQYDVYNDLGDSQATATTRPILGAANGGKLPYPRRLRTGRKMVGNDEIPLVGDKLPWLPLDERFNSSKNHAFTGGADNAAAKAARSLLGTPRGLGFALSLLPFIRKMYDKTPRNIFTNLSVIDALYDGLERNKDDAELFRGLLPVVRLRNIEVLKSLQSVWSKLDDGLKKTVGLLIPKQDIDDIVDKEDKKAKKAGDADKVGEENLGQKVDDVVSLVDGLLTKWPVPRIRESRALEWRSDEEFGRSALAGQNPFSIRAVTAEELKDFAVKDNHVSGLLENFKSLEESRAAEKLWVLDFQPGYEDYLKKVADLKEKRVLYAGRCLLFTRKDDVTVPISVELHTSGEKARVFTPKGPAEVWLLAKTIISSLDSGIHQLISHWLRTHACVEPYIIATRRELSVLNPVYKILKPHFRYTMRINCNARKALINAGGIVEQGFTPGPYSMELSAVVYKSWRFDEQSLPLDLLKRGVAEKEENGKLRLKLPKYSYAEDGLLLWEAIQQFVGDYLRVYYDDNSSDRKVTDDTEVIAWWKSIREEGHPDIKEGWPEITDIDSLRDILASIMWIASCHHAAVNFGQYDNSGYFPYKPSKITAKFPVAGSKEEQDLCNRFEGVLLDTITEPMAALAVMVTVKILSAHASDEEYLDREVHSYIKDSEGVKVHQKFVEAVNKAEQKIVERNEQRKGQGRGLPYTLLIPSNPETELLPGQRTSSRGIPYSISI